MGTIGSLRLAPERPVILIAESNGFSSDAATLLRRAGELRLADLDRKGLRSAVCDVDVLWVRLRHKIDVEILTCAPRLKVIVTPTTGLNHVDLEETARRGIAVISLRGETDFLQDVRATAEHTVALILSLLRCIPQSLTHVQNGNWNRDLFRGRELYEKTVGIVGYGRLGRMVSRYLKAFDARILVTDPLANGDSLDPNVALVPLSELLQQSDIISLHVNFHEERRRFFGRKQFSSMKKGSWFINTSRGELVDESAMLEALRSGWLAGAAVDVLSDECSEGMENHPLVAYAQENDNLIITPHIGGCTVESMDKTEYFLAGRLLTLMKHEAATN
jgi:D-3-phosphoglycerate dehydrogenase / 2-oxoglutarate reductase